jgi:hypothetical protein
MGEKNIEKAGSGVIISPPATETLLKEQVDCDVS